VITITFEADGLIQKLQRIEGRVKNLRPFLKDVGEYLIKQTRRRFAQGGVPKWKESVFNTTTLVKNGGLASSVKILETTDNSVTVGTESPNRFHNKGYFYTMKPGQRRWLFANLKSRGLYNKAKTGFMPGMAIVPERRFLKFDPEDYQFIATKLQQYIVKD
jgi:phage gpG-like protein